MPGHLWLVGILTLVWNGAGAVTIVMAQMGSRLDMDANEVAYYANQPLWFVLATDLAIFFPIAGAVALLLRRPAAAWLFTLSLLAIVVTNAYDVAAGTSLALGDQGWRNLTIVVGAIALLQIRLCLEREDTRHSEIGRRAPSADPQPFPGARRNGPGAPRGLPRRGA